MDDVVRFARRAKVQAMLALVASSVAIVAALVVLCSCADLHEQRAALGVRTVDDNNGGNDDAGVHSDDANAVGDAGGEPVVGSDAAVAPPDQERDAGMAPDQVDAGTDGPVVADAGSERVSWWEGRWRMQFHRTTSGNAWVSDWTEYWTVKVYAGFEYDCRVERDDGVKALVPLLGTRIDAQHCYVSTDHVHALETYDVIWVDATHAKVSGHFDDPYVDFLASDADQLEAP